MATPMRENESKQTTDSCSSSMSLTVSSQPKKKSLKRPSELEIDTSFDAAMHTDDDESPENDKFAFYRHQVAGHYPIFWNAGVICKPIQKNELEFYRHIQTHLPTLVEFVPRYLGVKTMTYGQLPPTPTEQKDSRMDFGNQKSQTAEFNRFNQWGLRCHNKKKQDLKKSSNIRYIELEDLTLPFSRPNILDLKIGTRVYGVNDDPQKIKRKIEKSASTTSCSLGLRLCGMQVYNPVDDTYTFRDKFDGRNLDEKGFVNSIKQFFTCIDGQLRLTVIERLIERILKLVSVVSEQKSFQFFSSSLLFICEGCGPKDQKRLFGTVKNDNLQRVDLRFIDFAQAARDTEEKGVDKGFLKGLGNIVTILRNLLASNAEDIRIHGAESSLENIAEAASVTTLNKK
mmetsp:Transcript_21451/g.52558  ORF Transcript_21451/g.52558 Transcript_21451/m.52558 type:complete len:399 (-) Transcript_21451:560-1756(-)